MKRANHKVHHTAAAKIRDGVRFAESERDCEFLGMHSLAASMGKNGGWALASTATADARVDVVLSAHSDHAGLDGRRSKTTGPEARSSKVDAGGTPNHTTCHPSDQPDVPDGAHPLPPHRPEPEALTPEALPSFTPSATAAVAAAAACEPSPQGPATSSALSLHPCAPDARSDHLLEVDEEAAEHCCEPRRKRQRSDRSQSRGTANSWTAEEDARLERLVSELGTESWSKIAKYMPERRGKQCRDRFVNHLKQDVKERSKRELRWSVQEERALVNGHRVLGPRWAALAQFLPGRAENSVKNHWYATQRLKGTTRSSDSCLFKYQRYLAGEAAAPAEVYEPTDASPLLLLCPEGAAMRQVLRQVYGSNTMLVPARSDPHTLRVRQEGCRGGLDDDESNATALSNPDLCVYDNSLDSNDVLQNDAALKNAVRTTFGRPHKGGVRGKTRMKRQERTVSKEHEGVGKHERVSASTSVGDWLFMSERAEELNGIIASSKSDGNNGCYEIKSTKVFARRKNRFGAEPKALERFTSSPRIMLQEVCAVVREAASIAQLGLAVRLGNVQVKDIRFFVSVSASNKTDAHRGLDAAVEKVDGLLPEMPPGGNKQFVTEGLDGNQIKQAKEKTRIDAVQDPRRGDAKCLKLFSE